MMQRLLEDWNDILIFILLLYVTAVYFSIFRYPNDTWKAKIEELKASKMSRFLLVGLPLVLLGFLIKIILEVIS